MKKSQYNKYFIILVLGFVLWVAETAYFGFNKTPQSGAEGLADTATALMMIYGVIGDLLRNTEIHKNYYKYKETNISTKKVEIKGDKPTVNQSTIVKMSDEAFDDLKRRVDDGPISA